MKRIVLSLLIVLGVFTGATAQKANMDARKLQLALFAISNLYVDSTSETKLVEDAIVGMLDKLDPHSNYMDPEETKEMTEHSNGPGGAPSLYKAISMVSAYSSIC